MYLIEKVGDPFKHPNSPCSSYLQEIYFKRHMQKITCEAYKSDQHERTFVRQEITQINLLKVNF